MGLLEDAAEWLNSQRNDFLSVPAVYLCRNGEVFQVKATVGKTLFRVENEYGVTVRTVSCDFLIPVKDLPTEPESGDTILYNGNRYEVLAPNGEPVWRWSGSCHITRRIHTKEIGGQNA